MAVLLNYCGRTARWQFTHKDNQYDLPVQFDEFSGQQIGVIKPLNYQCILHKVKKEIATASNWTWLSSYSLRNKPCGPLLDLLLPQLANFAMVGEPFDTRTPIPPPANKFNLLYCQHKIYNNNFMNFTLYYKSLCVARADVGLRNSMLYNLKVHSDWRSLGLAKQLLGYIFESSAPARCLIARPSLVNRGLELDSLISFYTKMGFKLVDPKTNYMERDYGCV